MPLMRLPSFISKAFLLTCCSIFIVSTLKYFNIYVISEWVSINCLFPCEFGFFWFFVCQVILDYILYMWVISSLITIISYTFHCSNVSIFSTSMRKLGLYLSQFAHISHDCTCVQAKQQENRQNTTTKQCSPHFLKPQLLQSKRKFHFSQNFRIFWTTTVATVSAT